MGNKQDGQDNGQTHTYIKPSDIEKYGNTDVKILAKAYEEYSKEGLTGGEKAKLKELDKLLEGANLISADGNAALIADVNGNCYNLLGSELQNGPNKTPKHR